MIFPVVLFCYSRVNCLKKTIEALSKNHLANQTKLIIYSDGAKNQNDEKKVFNVRAYLKTINSDLFSEVEIIESNENKGLAPSIISGISNQFKHYEALIVLEDDLVTSSNFLDFMNQALNDFKDVDNIHSISGYSAPIITNKKECFDNYFTQRASSWGWATWNKKWQNIDWEVKDYSVFSKDRIEKKKFNRMGSDMSLMLQRQMEGKISSWAIRWCYHQFKNDMYSVFPFKSKVTNIGLNDEDATHTKNVGNRYSTNIDESKKNNFTFNLSPSLDKYYLKQFTAPYSIKTRLKNKITKLIKPLFTTKGK